MVFQINWSRLHWRKSNCKPEKSMSLRGKQYVILSVSLAHIHVELEKSILVDKTPNQEIPILFSLYCPEHLCVSHHYVCYEDFVEGIRTVKKLRIPIRLLSLYTDMVKLMNQGVLLPFRFLINEFKFLKTGTSVTYYPSIFLQLNALCIFILMLKKN